MNDLKAFFAESALKVDTAMDEIITAAGIRSERLESAVRWSVFGGGKRMRPALVFAGGRAFDIRDEMLLGAAAAVELIHTYSLIHDDLPSMDNDDLRRGRATCHSKFDEATAILAGDILQSLAFGAIAADPSLLPEIGRELVRGLANAAAKMVSGQQLDIESEGKAVSSGGVEEIHKTKTGALITFSVTAGAIAAGAAENERRVIERYGEDIGSIFQITDDLLDITQTTETLGKTAAKDLLAEKATFPAVYGVDAAIRRVAELKDRAAAGLNSLGRPPGMLAEIPEYIASRSF
ncbi:MAG: polyprenyl synthetase family protein [Acidobacteriota bacterium]